jgi:nicotinate-nucleotide adenylyltransferase
MTDSTRPTGSLRAGAIGVLGGTFDPIHQGHVAAAAAAERALALGTILLIPSRLPPHRPERVRVSREHRLAMTTLAAADHPSWSVSDAELNRDGPSYTFETLTELIRQGHPASQIFFIIGADAFAEIATWSRYPAVLDLAHFAIVARPGITLDSLQKRLPDLSERMTTPDLFKPQASSLKPIDKTRVILIETATPDISSTEIRLRVREGESIAGLVPDSVAAYISQHRLYVGTNL